MIAHSFHDAVGNIIAHAGSWDRPYNVVSKPSVRHAHQVIVHAPTRSFLAGEIYMGPDDVVVYDYAPKDAQTNETRLSVEAFAKKLSDAYSTRRYRRGWGPCIGMMRARGMTDELIETVIRSKWTRWAADFANNPRHGYATSADLKRFLDTEGTNEEIARKLV